METASRSAVVEMLHTLLHAPSIWLR